MANPIPFKPTPVDPRTEMERRLAAAPTEHAEAILVAWDILQSAHDQGLLDAFHGLITAKDFVIGKLAAYAALPEGVAGVRNLIAAARILAAIDPEVLDGLSKAVASASAEHRVEQKPPSLWQLARRANTEDRR